MLHDGGSENGSSPPSCQDLPTQTLTLLNWCACSLSPSKAVWVQQKSKVTAEAHPRTCSFWGSQGMPSRSSERGDRSGLKYLQGPSAWPYSAAL